MFFVVPFLIEYISGSLTVPNHPVLLYRPLMHHGFCMRGKNQGTVHTTVLRGHEICIVVNPHCIEGQVPVLLIPMIDQGASES